MDFVIHGHRQGDIVLGQQHPYRDLWLELCEAIYEIEDEDIIDEFESNPREAKSISQAINRLIKYGLTRRGWESESFIFADDSYRYDERGRVSGIWRLDFAKEPLCVEVAFNHRSDISWNLIKPTLASELNHVEKAVQCDGGIVVTATREMKYAGGFDRAVGTFEDYVQYLRPLSQILTSPLIIVGLLPPETFDIEWEHRGRQTIGHVRRF